MATKRKVDRPEYNRWVKLLEKRGYRGPFAELTTKHECVKFLEKELKKGTIPGTRPRDRRTIASNLTHYAQSKGEPEAAEATLDEWLRANIEAERYGSRLHINRDGSVEF